MFPSDPWRNSTMVSDRLLGILTIRKSPKARHGEGRPILRCQQNGETCGPSLCLGKSRNGPGSNKNYSWSQDLIPDNAGTGSGVVRPIPNLVPRRQHKPAFHLDIRHRCRHSSFLLKNRMPQSSPSPRERLLNQGACHRLSRETMR